MDLTTLRQAIIDRADVRISLSHSFMPGAIVTALAYDLVTNTVKVGIKDGKGEHTRITRRAIVDVNVSETSKVSGTPLTREQLLAASHTPRFWEFTNLTDAYTEVQTNDDVEDSDVIITQSPTTGLTVGFVFQGAWVCTVHADQPSARWEATDDLAALVANNPEYALAASQAAHAVKVCRASREHLEAWSRASVGSYAPDLAEAATLAGAALDEAETRRDQERAAYRRVRDEARCLARCSCGGHTL